MLYKLCDNIKQIDSYSLIDISKQANHSENYNTQQNKIT